MANKHHILILPTDSDSESSHFKSLAISRHDGFCRSFAGSDQATFNGTTVNLDPLYDVVWAYNNNTGMVNSLQPTIAAQTKNDIKETIITPELALPLVSKTKVSRMQASLNILSCLDTLTNYPEVNISGNEEDTSKNVSAKSFSKEDFTPVNRFDNHGGGWGYSGHSIEVNRHTHGIKSLTIPAIAYFINSLHGESSVRDRGVPTYLFLVSKL